jgi:hypothetical protein
VHYRLVRLLENNLPDSGFGTNGSVVLSHPRGTVPVLSHVSADGRYFYLVSESETQTLITRILLVEASAGQLDISFGQLGTVTIHARLGLRAAQGLPDGSLLISGPRGTLRLLGANLPSPGLLSFSVEYIPAFDPGEKAVNVKRSAGFDGQVSVDFATASGSGSGSISAVVGQDYLPASGRLAWADGEREDQTMKVTLLEGFFSQSGWIYLNLSNPAGGAMIGISASGLFRGNPNYSPPPSRPPPSGGGQAGGGTQGGGGVTDLLSLLAVVLLLSTAHMRFRRRSLPTSLRKKIESQRDSHPSTLAMQQVERARQ